MYSYASIARLVELATTHQVAISEIALRHEMEISGESAANLLQVMAGRLAVMQQAAQRGLLEQEKIAGAMVGGDAAKMARASGILLGNTAHQGMKIALAVAEQNAGMGQVVAAPTAGSCGVLPGVLLALQTKMQCDDKALTQALFTAGAIGAIIDANATLSGAEGGCQAECGAAGAMAAAAAVELTGGSPRQAAHAIALGLKNLLGLACDPVGGLVQVPCVRRNAFVTVHALAAAELALAGVESFIPADEVIEAMGQIGRLMPRELRETSLGGLAVTPTAKNCWCIK
jgi:L-serine dehydratase